MRAPDPTPVVLVGAGGMGKAWLQAIADEPRADLVGLVDLDLDVARSALTTAGREDLPVSDDAVALAEQTQATALINVTIPEAHHAVTTAGLQEGLAVLSEKPVAHTLPQALSLTAASEVTGQLFMISQSRSYNRHLSAMKSHAQQLGDLGVLAAEFFKAPRFGGFRDAMEHPLLVDMAIHAFDAARFLTDTEPVSVYCEEFNPSWSWYRGNAAASAIFQMSSGLRFNYTGSWCSAGQETSWNGRWRLSAEHGTVLWDGDHEPEYDDVAPAPDLAPEVRKEGISGALAAFLDALARGITPRGEVHQNLMSLVMVQAAVESSVSGQRVQISEVLEQAHQQALAEETDPLTRAQLQAWPSAQSALRAPST